MGFSSDHQCERVTWSWRQWYSRDSPSHRFSLDKASVDVWSARREKHPQAETTGLFWWVYSHRYWVTRLGWIYRTTNFQECHGLHPDILATNSVTQILEVFLLDFWSWGRCFCSCQRFSSRNSKKLIEILRYCQTTHLSFCLETTGELCCYIHFKILRHRYTNQSK